eukprot:TRINITY_DN3180_c0_g1_i10.p1 TRINITY_DN3180_c0_g1~~TRINITY_DN3180_c0_g1_i10.p1  ORF type:complete len:871 (+),score=193.33 TRINITY_DN3180_c0_g1_i10:267-2879(+)
MNAESCADGPTQGTAGECSRWRCVQCEYYNRQSRRSCALCLCPRDGASTWQCGRCSLFNRVGVQRCVVCRTPRQRRAPECAPAAAAPTDATGPLSPAAISPAPAPASVGPPVAVSPSAATQPPASTAPATPPVAVTATTVPNPSTPVGRSLSPPPSPPSPTVFCPPNPPTPCRCSPTSPASPQHPPCWASPSSVPDSPPSCPPSPSLPSPCAPPSCPPSPSLPSPSLPSPSLPSPSLPSPCSPSPCPPSSCSPSPSLPLPERADSWLADREARPDTLDAQLVSMQDKVAAIEAQVGSGKWTDPDFPASAESLGPGLLREYQWRRADDVDKPVRGSWELAAEVDGVRTLSTGAMTQGELGDCWFLSALSVVCMRPDLASRLLISQTVSKQGVYCLRFWKDGVWTPVFVDDHLPVVDWGALAFAQTKGCNQLWPSLVEKAFAKLHGSYAAIESGNASEAFAALTGAPCESIDLSPSADLDTDVVWSRMISSLECGSLLAAACGQDGMEQSSRQLGLVTSHSYSVQNVLIGPRGVRLVKLRNPWGSTEWKGAWGDHDDRNWTAELRREYQSQQVLDDGVFHMSFPDFLTHFRSVCICHAYEGWFSDSRECSFSKRFHPTGLTAQFSRQYVIETTQPTRMFLSVVQRSKGGRWGDGNAEKDVGLFVVKGTPKAEDVEGQQPVAAMFANDKRISTCEFVLSEPGTYVALPYSLLNTADDTPYSIAVWASKPFTLDAVTRPSVRSITHAAHVCMRTPAIPGLGVSVWEGSSMRVYTLQTGCGIWYLVENTNPKGGSAVERTLSFSGVRSLQPSRGRLITTDVLMPGERQITTILTSAGASWGMQSLVTYQYVRTPPPVRHDPALPPGPHIHEVMCD